MAGCGLEVGKRVGGVCGQSGRFSAEGGQRRDPSEGKARRREGHGSSAAGTDWAAEERLTGGKDKCSQVLEKLETTLARSSEAGSSSSRVLRERGQWRLIGGEAVLAARSMRSSYTSDTEAKAFDTEPIFIEFCIRRA